MIDQIEIDLRSSQKSILTLHIDVFDNSLSHKWLAALNDLLVNDLHLEKNYCWLGWPESHRNIVYICDSINSSITAINQADLGYHIDDFFSPQNTIDPNGDIDHAHMNQLHRYFEDLQGVSGALSPYYLRADARIRWHIRQLNLLCHEHESLVLSLKKLHQAPEWRRPSQLMCWLNAPRYQLEPEDFDLFGIDTLNRKMGGVYVGINKAVGKAHWEVFNDEARDVSELVTSTLRSQTEAAGDFDIEWARDPGAYHWQIKKIQEFRQWLVSNGFDPLDPELTIGHPQVAQVDLMRSFGTVDYEKIWQILARHLDVYEIRTSEAKARYNYCWSDADYAEVQIRRLT